MKPRSKSVWMTPAAWGALAPAGMVQSLSLIHILLPVLFLPLAATMVRRLHDVGKSGLFLRWLAVPVVGWLLLMYLCYGESLPGENKYGDPPWS